MRLFVALPVDDEVRERLAVAVEPWRTDASGSGPWRWTRPEGWHVTVAFLGEVDEERAGEAGRVAGVAAAGTGPVDLRLGGLRRFGRRVLHVALEDEPSGAVATLGAEVQGALASAGLPVQEREVRPHLTLARARRRTAPSVPAVDVPSARWRVERARLYRSQLGPGGARYEVLEELPLA